jgi:hypothetical protein
MDQGGFLKLPFMRLRFDESSMLVFRKTDHAYQKPIGAKKLLQSTPHNEDGSTCIIVDNTIGNTTKDCSR